MQVYGINYIQTRPCPFDVRPPLLRKFIKFNAFSVTHKEPNKLKIFTEVTIINKLKDIVDPYEHGVKKTKKKKITEL